MKVTIKALARKTYMTRDIGDIYRGRGGTPLNRVLAMTSYGHPHKSLKLKLGENFAENRIQKRGMIYEEES